MICLLFRGAYGNASIQIAKNAEHFFEISLWYSKKRITESILKLYAEALKGCYEKGKLEFRYGRNAFIRSIRRAQTMVEEERPSWRQQRTRLGKLLSVYSKNRIAKT